MPNRCLVGTPKWGQLLSKDLAYGSDDLLLYALRLTLIGMVEMKIACCAALFAVLVLDVDGALARSCTENFSYCFMKCSARKAARSNSDFCSHRCLAKEHKCMSTSCYRPGLCGLTPQ
jgi:hypothetical protein